MERSNAGKVLPVHLFINEKGSILFKDQCASSLEVEIDSIPDSMILKRQGHLTLPFSYEVVIPD